MDREILRYERTWELEDIEIQRGGDGRTVTAYAAVFNKPAEVRDQHGHYIEDVDPVAFNRDIARARPQGGRDYWLANCYYNHGADLSGKPNGLLSVPLGSPLDIKPDGNGLLTVTRYNKTELADSVLEAIRNGDIRAQSFRGRVYKSTEGRSRDGRMKTIRRMELGLTEYGPTPSAVYKDATIVAVRAEQVAQNLAELTADERAELIRMLTSGAPLEDSPLAAVASEVELDAGDSLDERSVRLAIRRARARAELILTGVE
jgi:HK97 family phage prohead protease